MALAQSKLTSQGQISVPAEIRRRLGLATGSILEWDEDGANVIVRRAGTNTSEAVHLALFSSDEPKPEPKTLAQLRDGVRESVRKRHARG